MRVILFQPRFVPMIEAGTKTTTIRKHARCHAGDILSLRQWMDKPYRSKQREITMKTCIGVHDVRIANGTISLGGFVLRGMEEQKAVEREGFADFAELRDWFSRTHGLPFTGEMIAW